MIPAGLLLCVPTYAQSSMPEAAASTENFGDVLTLNGPAGRTVLADYIDYFIDEGWDKTPEDMLGVDAGRFSDLQSGEPDFGYTDSRIWLRIKLANGTANDRQFLVYVRENFLQYYDVYLQREAGRIDHIENHNPDSPFSARTFSFPELVTPFQLKPNEQATLLVSYWSEGSSNAAIAIETGKSFAALAMGRTSKNFISYGMIAILLVSGLIAFAILRLKIFAAYVTYVFVILLYLMHTDGITFQYFWPQFPRFNSYFTIIIGTGCIMATYNFARVFLQTKTYHPRIDKIFLIAFFVTPVITFGGAAIDIQAMKQAMMVMVFIAIAAGTLAGAWAGLTRFRQVRFYLFAWAVGLLTAGVMNMRHIFGIDISQDVEFDSIRVSMVVDAMMIGLGIADHYTQTLRARSKATERSLTEARKNLKLTTRLYELDQQYLLAEELVRSRDVEMKNTVHDLRQPLHALRLSVAGLRDGGEGSAVDVADIDNTFTYLETLIAERLEETVGADDYFPADQGGEDLSLSKVLRSVYDMFLPDAAEKGLDFRFVKTSADADIDPLVLMRVITNLVANAIKYTPSGKVLLGVRRAQGRIQIEVHDTGPGMDEADFNLACKRSVRLGVAPAGAAQIAEVTGHGFGLAIASDLAEKHGLNLRVHAGRRTGCGVILDVPTVKGSQTA